jgi:hypothetical protein
VFWRCLLGVLQGPGDGVVVFGRRWAGVRLSIVHGRRVSSLKSLFLMDRDHGRELSFGSMLRQHAQKVTHPDQGLLDRVKRAAETGDSLWRSDWL